MKKDRPEQGDHLAGLAGLLAGTFVSRNRLVRSAAVRSLVWEDDDQVGVEGHRLPLAPLAAIDLWDPQRSPLAVAGAGGGGREQRRAA